MKKIKIFLLLGLLVFFGFAISTEVHAQSDGPKVFEVGEVLPASTPVLPYLTFQSTSSFTLNVYDNTKHWDGTLYYSTDTTTWNVWDGTTTLSSVGNKLYLRGTGNTIITGSSSDYRWVLTGSNIECIGNIENLLDWETVALGNQPTMADYCYSNMFADCTALTTAPSLPATTLATSCYSSMFQNCSALATAPSLPATTLSDYCYYFMFYGCTALTTAPSLPATILANDCYSSMFRDCTSLATAPSLPATTLSDFCYLFMFAGCTALTTAPSLPATTLATSCYSSMFRDCTALTTAPSLPATTLANYCYYNMFNGCTALKVSTTQTGTYQYAWRIPTSGTGTPATNWNSSMLSGTGGTFTGEPIIDTTYYVENPPVSVSSEDPSIIYDDLYNLYNGEELDIELGYTLPAAKIAINLVYNNTGGQDDGMIVYTFGTYGRIALTAFEDMSPYVYETQAIINVIVLDDNWNMNILHDSLASQGFGSRRGILSAGMIIDLTDASEEERTITGIDISNLSDSRIEMDCIFSRILSIDESIYQEGYSEGREIYGYYDDDTDQWLSVDEYLELYGEKMSSSNFYTNFDKYFIPAMIIVFGGAIVLTVLKVFKKRE